MEPPAPAPAIPAAPMRSTFIGPPRGPPVITGKTLVGMIVGAAIIAIGGASFLMDLGLQEVVIDEMYAAGERASYRFSAEAGARQHLVVVADRFEVEMTTPGDGGRPALASHRDRATLDWYHDESGESTVHVRNTGPSEMKIAGVAQVTTDPIYFTYHVLVMISGVVIMGFSAAFSLRRPRGF